MHLDSQSTLSKTVQEISITVFPRLPASSCGGRGCSCDPAGAAPSADLDLLLSGLDQLKPRFGSRLSVQVAQYTTGSEIQQVIEELNLALETSNINYRVSSKNLVTLLMAAAPIVVVNNAIVANGDLDQEEILKHVETL